MAILNSPMKRWLFLLGFALVSTVGHRSWAEPAISKEYQVKAVFLFNFTQFIQWPPAAFSRSSEPFCIGILGEDPFGPFLDQTIQGEKVKGHPLIVKRYRTLAEVKKCQILFVSRSEDGHWPAIVEAMKGKGVLMVGDQEGFARTGGVMGFKTENNKIKLGVNVEAAKREKLAISSKILRLAEIVETEKK
jgi:hypothetical protein